MRNIKGASGELRELLNKLKKKLHKPRLRKKRQFSKKMNGST
jgi:hypothetical protein